MTVSYVIAGFIQRSYTQALALTGRAGGLEERRFMGKKDSLYNRAFRMYPNFRPKRSACIQKAAPLCVTFKNVPLRSASVPQALVGLAVPLRPVRLTATAALAARPNRGCTLAEGASLTSTPPQYA
ncbi:hypothetical protein NDU88_000858 [Pleurodeles waltl]|uniref:Uncharacterized protein n=1 Tax=Pleurodeles waltl TaxID=8319 RepID=A0AAV7S5Q2_PLEWA|nr:hypothetical protein NDU88_000858 [Pleurodeles waltl]